MREFIQTAYLFLSGWFFLLLGILFYFYSLTTFVRVAFSNNLKLFSLDYVLYFLGLGLIIFGWSLLPIVDKEEEENVSIETPIVPNTSIVPAQAEI